MVKKEVSKAGKKNDFKLESPIRSMTDSTYDMLDPIAGQRSVRGQLEWQSGGSARSRSGPLKDAPGLKRAETWSDDNNRRFRSIIRVPAARPNSSTSAKLRAGSARDKRSKFLLSSGAVVGCPFDEYSEFQRVVDASRLRLSSPFPSLCSSLNYYIAPLCGFARVDQSSLTLRASPRDVPRNAFVEHLARTAFPLEKITHSQTRLTRSSDFHFPCLFALFLCPSSLVRPSASQRVCSLLKTEQTVESVI